MSRILVVYSSRDGQTAAIARRLARTMENLGHAAEVLPAETPSLAADLAASDIVVIGAGIRYGSHGAVVERVVHEHLADIVSRPNAFFSVSLSAGGPGAHPENACKYVAEFAHRTHWQPQRTACFAGALLYTKYNLLLRMMMRFIAGRAGGDTDTSRDYEYTDWEAVDRFAREIVASAHDRLAA